MRLLNATLPSAPTYPDGRVDFDQYADLFVEISERALNRKHKNKPRPTPVSATERATLKAHYLYYLTEAYAQKRVRVSPWGGTPKGKRLRALWESEAQAPRGLREALREALEEVDLCPLCQLYRNPATGDGNRLPVDHYLPRTEWPELSLLPTNLIPICDTCNSRLKGGLAPQDQGHRLFIHPYFDTFVDRMRVLCLYSIREDTVCLDFRPDTQFLDDDERIVVGNHMVRLNISSRYARLALRQVLPDLRVELRYRIGSGQIASLEALSRELDIRYRSSRETKGDLHWKTALFLGLRDSRLYLESIAGESDLPEGTR